MLNWVDHLRIRLCVCEDGAAERWDIEEEYGRGGGGWTGEGAGWIGLDRLCLT